MWTCDIIKAMQKVEERIGYPFCIQSIQYLHSAPSVLVITTTDDEVYYYDITDGTLIGEE